MKICPKCQHTVNIDFLFCPKCGENLKNCHHCGKEFPDGANFCPYCGKAIKVEPIVPTTPVKNSIAYTQQDDIKTKTSYDYKQDGSAGSFSLISPEDFFQKTLSVMME